MELDIVRDLQLEYERCIKQTGPDPYSGYGTIGIHTVLRAHFLIVDHFWKHNEGVGGVGPRSFDLLHSAVSRQTVGFDGRRKWIDPFDVCATLFFGLIKDHPFHDCNKRTAILSALHHLYQNGRKPKVTQRELEVLTISTANDSLSEYDDYSRFGDQDDPEVRFISHFFRRGTSPIDKNNYTVTFQQLDRILRKKGGFYLGHADGNFIWVMRQKERRTGILGQRKEMIEERVLKVGFPGMKAQVFPSTIKAIRRATGLTHENHCDSETFFRDADPMQSLIAVYDGLLLRLAYQ